ncbi:LppP/LprE family lipoprotein [Nocardia sp. NPDC048505]|uniref:LppP/LprE family lipoprotein n=1 Tax=unclassified Nocardia TaxID=2637762 RepID=UPI0033E977A3
MKDAVRVSALIAVFVASVAGCSTENDSATTSSTTRASSAAPTTPKETAGGQQPDSGDPAAPEATEAPGMPSEPGTPPVTSKPQPANDISGPGRCIDPASTGVQNALGRLGDRWVASQASTDQPGKCGELLWVRAVGGNSAAAPVHVLFFGDGEWLGTATSDPYAFTSVVGASGNAVTVQYKWLVGDEPFAAPQGGPATITYTWNGSKLTMSQPLPPEVTHPR